MIWNNLPIANVKEIIFKIIKNQTNIVSIKCMKKRFRLSKRNLILKKFDL